MSVEISQRVFVIQLGEVEDEQVEYAVDDLNSELPVDDIEVSGGMIILTVAVNDGIKTYTETEQALKIQQIVGQHFPYILS